MVTVVLFAALKKELLNLSGERVIPLLEEPAENILTQQY